MTTADEMMQEVRQGPVGHRDSWSYAAAYGELVGKLIARLDLMENAHGRDETFRPGGETIRVWLRDSIRAGRSANAVKHTTSE